MDTRYEEMVWKMGCIILASFMIHKNDSFMNGFSFGVETWGKMWTITFHASNYKAKFFSKWGNHTDLYTLDRAHSFSRYFVLNGFMSANISSHFDGRCSIVNNI